MPRKPRLSAGGHVYHVLNRAARRGNLFTSEDDYSAFIEVLKEANSKTPMRILAYCLMPNHWHLLLWPFEDGDLQAFTQWLTATHARRWNAAHDSVGRGAVYQSRFKSIPVQSDRHLQWVWRYVERNALRAGLVERAEDWKWGSLSGRLSDAQICCDGPCELPDDWKDLVNTPQTADELIEFRAHVANAIPFGEGPWIVQRARGRPRVYDIQIKGSDPIICKK